MLEDFFDHFLIFDESDDSHLTTALGTGQGINFIDFLDQPGPVLPVFLRTFIGFQVEDSTLRDAGDPVVFGFFSLSPRDITVVAIISDHLLPPVRDVGTHGGQPLQSIEDLFFGSVFRAVDNL